MRSKEVEEAINILDEYIVESVSKPIVDYIEELENNSISKETLRKIKANTDTYRDFTEEVLKLL